MPRPTGSDVEPTTVRGVLRWMVRHPWSALVRRWNYKSAVLSAVLRASIFFGANRAAGVDAAVAAMITEFCFRISTAGFYGAVTQAFRRVEPPQAGTIAAMVVLPLVTHSLEFIVHWWRGTPELGVSIAASVMLYGDLDVLQSLRDAARRVRRRRRRASRCCRTWQHCHGSWRCSCAPRPGPAYGHGPDVAPHHQLVPSLVRWHSHVLYGASRGREPRAAAPVPARCPDRRTA